MLGFLRRAPDRQAEGPAPRIAVTGATGGLGGAVVRALTARHPTGRIRALGRDKARLAQLAGFGVATATADYDDLGSLVLALDGVDVLLVVPTWDFGHRTSQHARILRAARETGVGRVVYAGAKPHGRGDLLTKEHVETEALVQDSGLAWTILRSNLYMSLFVPDVETAVRLGYHATSVGGGGAALVDRADLARACTAVLLDARHARATYHISGPKPVSALDIAAVASMLRGSPVPVQHLSRQGMEDHLRAQGQSPREVDIALNLEDALREGQLLAPSGDLAAITGTPGREFAAYVRQRLGKAKAPA